MKWPKLVQGILIKRYQRFKADVRLRNSRVVTALCSNTGRMLTCSEPGRRVYLSRTDNPHRRLKYNWELIEMPTSLVGVNTMVPNRLVEEAISKGKIAAFSGYERMRREVRYGENSRIDLLLEKGNEKCFIEVKNCTLSKGGVAYFPDAITARGLKHLIELQHQVEANHRSVMFYLVQRMDAKAFSPANFIDPAYGEALLEAAGRGVEIMVYDVKLNLESIQLNKPLPYQLS